MCRWLAVSDDGDRFPSTIFPSRSSTIKCSGFKSGYFTPDGLITTRPVSGSRPLTLPPVHLTRSFLGSSRCNFQTCSRRASNTPHLTHHAPRTSCVLVLVIHVKENRGQQHQTFDNLLPIDPDSHNRHA